MVVIPFAERRQLLLEGKIDFLQYVMNSEMSTEYIQWCKTSRTEPDADSAELFCELTEIDMEEHQFIDDESVGYWA